ncbi:hypothetical protein [Enterococcus mundtii]|uniref:hypothetical protein n=1 Tax=Enterococcus mundtii TaxID=53346 RepID=UPI001A968D74|nr:hypothetical protein [Enterococcus mundtii]MBO1087189.1 hypothetical protein [Enterococcus mundtii]
MTDKTLLDILAAYNLNMKDKNKVIELTEKYITGNVIYMRKEWRHIRLIRKEIRHNTYQLFLRG